MEGVVTVVVLGSNGMLGRHVLALLSSVRGLDVKPVARDTLDASQPGVRAVLDDLARDWRGRVYVVNCIGVIPQRVDPQAGLRQYIAVNACFPHILAAFCDAKGFLLIHVSTDCVYDGLRGGYGELDPHTETNIYGTSKSCGEPPSAMIIRTSIIGEEAQQSSGRSLLEWVRSQRGATIRGFENHFWNGVTCLELAKVVQRIIAGRIEWKGVRHIVSPKAVSKLELVACINSVYELDCSIVPFRTDIPANKTLLPSMDTRISSLTVLPIEEQVAELREFWKSRRV